jgi:hypothetical protein
MWLKAASGGYLNSDFIVSMSTYEKETDQWVIRVDFSADVTEDWLWLAGTWSTQADADTIVRQLVQVTDPSVL